MRAKKNTVELASGKGVPIPSPKKSAAMIGSDAAATMLASDT